MSLPITVTCSDLFGELKQQYIHLPQETPTNLSELEKKYELSRKYKITELDLPVDINVKMSIQETRVSKAVPVCSGTGKGVEFCGGVKSKVSAEVTVNPENQKVIETTLTYFKREILPDMPLFNSVTINGKTII